jgi:hypothetical protein
LVAIIILLHTLQVRQHVFEAFLMIKSRASISY